MKSTLIICFCVTITLVGVVASQGNQERSPKPLRAPTYYLVAEVNDCEPDPNYVEFRGASNLPTGAMITTEVADFDLDAWKLLSDDVYVPVDEGGFFSGKILPEKGLHFRHNLILLVDFTPFRPTQPRSVLTAIGDKGERLADVENVLLKNIGRPSVNPQLVDFSGGYQGLHTIARVPHCGEK